MPCKRPPWIRFPTPLPPLWFLAAMIIMRLTSINVDGFGGLLVAIFILYAGIKAVKDTMDPLLGKAPDQTFVREIRAIVMSHPKVHGIHDLIVHDYGPGRRMITLHLEVPGGRRCLSAP